MALAFLEEDLDDIDGQPGRLRQADAIRRRRIGCGLPDAQRRATVNRYDLSDGRVPIEHGNRLAAPDRPQVLTQPRLQVSDSNLLHDPIMTRNSHKHKPDLTVFGSD